MQTVRTLELLAQTYCDTGSTCIKPQMGVIDCALAICFTLFLDQIRFITSVCRGCFCQ
jgi:hypothetical protein